jgi:hypothetical protein
MARMRQTTLRFGEDLWEQLRREADGAGVSVAQFVREAAIARVAYEAGRRGDVFFETAMSVAAEVDRTSDVMRYTIGDTSETSRAVWAQGELAREQARKVREHIRVTRERRGANRRAAPTADPLSRPPPLLRIKGVPDAIDL